MPVKERLINRYRKLKQYQNCSEEELNKLATHKLEEKGLKSSFVGLIEEEVDRAISLYYKYLDENSFESLAEKSSLINLVYKEILKERIQDFIKKESEDKEGAIKLTMIEKMMELDAQILTDKKELKMLDTTGEDSVSKRWEDLKQSCLKYYEENAAEFINKCPYCYKLFPSILPPDKLEPQKSSWFLGTDIYNEEVFELYHNKIISKESASKILGVSTYYIEYIYKEIYLKKKNDTKSE